MFYWLKVAIKVEDGIMFDWLKVAMPKLKTA